MAENKTHTFIKNAKLVHGERYLYHKCAYINAKTKVEIICNEHGSFFITPNNCLSGKGCRGCGIANMKRVQKLSIDTFIMRSKEVHGDTYDYSKVIMNGVDHPVTIVCSIHGEFQQTPWRHYAAKNGCSNCGVIKRADSNRYTLDYFIKTANEVHRDAYDYTKVKYINSQTYVTITCKKHGDFEQIPASHLQGCGCKLCGQILSHDKQRKSIDEFIIEAKKVHGDLYDYSQSKWNSCKDPIVIICKIHGEFEQNPQNHLKGYGCKRCTFVYNLDDFVLEAKKVHGNLYDYSLSIYDKSRNPVKIICKKCGVFEQSPNSHLGGAGCPICVNKTESKLYAWLKSIYPNTVKEYKVDWCVNPITGKHFRYDFMIPDIKIIIELDGRQHFKQVGNWGEPEETMKRDVFKMQKAKAAGYKIIRIFQEDVYNNDNYWLTTVILPHIVNLERNDVFIGSIQDLYDEHTKLIKSGAEIVFDTNWNILHN